MKSGNTNHYTIMDILAMLVMSLLAYTCFSSPSRADTGLMAKILLLAEVCLGLPSPAASCVTARTLLVAAHMPRLA